MFLETSASWARSKSLAAFVRFKLIRHLQKSERIAPGLSSCKSLLLLVCACCQTFRQRAARPLGTAKPISPNVTPGDSMLLLQSEGSATSVSGAGDRPIEILWLLLVARVTQRQTSRYGASSEGAMGEIIGPVILIVLAW